jgi:hypothetical protein
MQRLTDRSHRPASRFGDICSGLVVRVSLAQQTPLLVSQFSVARFECFATIVEITESVGRIGGNPVSRDVTESLLLAAEFETSRPSLIVGDGECPCTKVRAGLELVGFTPKDRVGFLQDILGRVPVGDHRVNEGPQNGLVSG